MAQGLLAIMLCQSPADVECVYARFCHSLFSDSGEVSDVANRLCASFLRLRTVPVWRFLLLSGAALPQEYGLPAFHFRCGCLPVSTLFLDTFWNIKFSFEVLLAVRFLLGAFLGLAQMSLASTLVIDSCESFQRTEANYITSWFARFSIAVGPLVACLVYINFGMGYVFPTASVLALGAFVLVSCAKFPFKAPAEGIKVFSLDRFYLPQGTPLFINIILITFSAGLYFSVPHTPGNFLMIFGGLVLAFLAEKFVFADADLKSQILVGLILLASAELISFGDQDFAVEIVVPTLLGFSLGIIGSRFLLFYIKLAKHCQRGTSVNSFFLAWELGLSLGLGLGFMFHNLPARVHFDVDHPVYNMVESHMLHHALLFTIVSLLVYNFLVHPWYMKHKNR